MAKKSQSGSEGLIYHYGAVRSHVTGNGSLRLTLYSLDEVQSSVLSPLTLQSTSAIELNRLSNFTQQRAKLQIKTTGIGETFSITKITIFIKPVAKSWPETS